MKSYWSDPRKYFDKEGLGTGDAHRRNASRILRGLSGKARAVGHIWNGGTDDQDVFFQKVLLPEVLKVVRPTFRGTENKRIGHNQIRVAIHSKTFDKYDYVLDVYRDELVNTIEGIKKELEEQGYTVGFPGDLEVTFEKDDEVEEENVEVTSRASGRYPSKLSANESSRPDADRRSARRYDIGAGMEEGTTRERSVETQLRVLVRDGNGEAVERMITPPP